VANTDATHVRLREGSNTRITRTKRHYPAHVGTPAKMASQAPDRPIAGKLGCGAVSGRGSRADLGREATTLYSILVYTAAMGLNGQNNLIDGQPIPYKLEGYSNNHWSIDAEGVTESLVAVRLSFGHGVQLEQSCELNRNSSLPHRTSKAILMPPSPRKGLLRFIKRKGPPAGTPNDDSASAP
jgi:hypothetical protein